MQFDLDSLPRALAGLWSLLRHAVAQVVPEPYGTWLLASVPVIAVLGLFVRYVVNPLRRGG